MQIHCKFIKCDFADYGINSILYQRGIYPEESFKQSQKYGLTLLVTDDDKLTAFLNEVSISHLNSSKLPFRPKSVNSDKYHCIVY